MFITEAKDIKEFLKSKFMLIVKKNQTKLEAPGIKSGGRPLTRLASATSALMKVASHCQPHLASA